MCVCRRLKVNRGDSKPGLVRLSKSDCPNQIDDRVSSVLYTQPPTNLFRKLIMPVTTLTPLFFALSTRLTTLSN